MYRWLRRSLAPLALCAVLAAGERWRVDLDLEDRESAQVIVTDDDGNVVSEQPVPYWEPPEPGEALRARVIADPIAGEFAVIVDDGAVLLPGSVLSTSPISTHGSAATSELCERLAERL